MKKVLVIGASGLVGSRFCELAKNKIEIIPVDEKILDITDKTSVDKYFSENKFDSVINFAAYTNVDGAEKERENKDGICYKINVLGPKNLAEACKKTNIFLIHISSDFVFRGTNEEPGPYSEDIEPSSSLESEVGWYGLTKLQAEVEIQKSEIRNAIVRIAYPFSPFKYDLKLDFAKNYLKLYDEGKLFPIFADQIITPLLVEDLINPLVKILEKEFPGIFHIVSSDTTTSFDFVGYLLKKTRGVDNVIQKGSMEEFLKDKNKTPRPRLGGLKTEITQKKLGMKFKTWKEMINSFAENL